jgi:periplasmic protein CpxP/Spy
MSVGTVLALFTVNRQHLTEQRNRRSTDMKILSIVFAVILLIGSAGTVMAGPKGPPSDAAGAPGIGRGMGQGSGCGMGPCGAGGAALANLNLSDEQAVKIQALREAHLKDIVPIQNQLFSARNELRLLWNQTDPDIGQITAKQQEMDALRSQLREKVTQHLLEVRKLLTPEQQAKLAVTGPGMGRGMGGGHGRGGAGMCAW